MLTLTLGPLVFTPQQLLILLALFVASRLRGPQDESDSRRHFRTLLLLAALGLLVARLAFVARYWDAYQANPLDLLNVRDGGLYEWAGAAAVLLVTGLWVWRRPARWPSLGRGVLAALALWAVGTLSLMLYERSIGVPDLALRHPDGQVTRLADYRGQPLVVNLWASWCPPCRKEMPVLAEAQRRHPQITFVFLNQGESAYVAAQFLSETGVRLQNSLLDPGGAAGQAFGSQALPTTIFFDAEGQRLGSHLGELSAGSLARYLRILQDDEE